MGVKKFFNEWLFILFGITFLTVGISLMIGNDLYNTYQILRNEIDNIFLAPWSLFDISSNGHIRTLVWLGLAGIITILGILMRDVFLFSLTLLLILELEIFLESTYKSKYLFDLDLSFLLFLFVPIVLLLSKTSTEKIISFIIVSLGFIVLTISGHIKELLFYFLATFLSVIFLINLNKRYIFFSSILGMIFILGTLEYKKIINLISNRIDPYLDKVLAILYTKEISLLPKNEILFSTKTVYNLWQDFVPLYILEKFGWFLGIFILSIPIFFLLYGLWLSIKNFDSNYGKAIFLLTIITIIYTVTSLLPLLPGFPKYGLFFPLYGYITGLIIFWLYLTFLILILKKDM